MTPTQYETTLVVDAHLSNEQIESAVEKYAKLITDNGGTIKLIDRWGKRRLAYEIKKKQYGFYVYIRFEAPGTLIKLMEREIKLDDFIIRHLTVIVPQSVVANEIFEPEKTSVSRESDETETSDEADDSDDSELDEEDADSDEDEEA